MKKGLASLSLFLCSFLVLILVYSGIAFAQEQYGNIRGVVVDEQGEALPGVAVTLGCEMYGKRSVSASEGGIFRFLNLAPGMYSLKCELPGFKTHIHEIVDIRVGTNFDFRVVLEPAALEEEVTVVATSPIVDSKKTGVVTVVTLDALQNIPSARDPWVILQQVPGVFVSVENVGGSESGMQSGFTARGSWGYDNTWNLDGIPITDLSGAGGSPMYYDFDTFEQMEIVTGGQDATVQTGGIALNFVTRRGGNKFQVMARAYFTNDDLQGDNLTQELIDLDYVGNQIDQILDYGLQLGGPIKKDRVWFWLGYGVQDLRHLTIAGYPENYKITGFNAKLNFQLSKADRAELAFNYNDKTAEGRGAGPYNPPETTVDQKGISPYYIKLEGEHVFSPEFLLSLKLSYHSAGFEWIPQGGVDTQVGLDMATGMYSGSRDYLRTERPSYVAMVQGNYFLEEFLGGNHEFKYGAEFRFASQDGIQGLAGNARKYYSNGVPVYAEVTREAHLNHACNRWSFYLNDAFDTGRLTLNLGVRLDREDSWNREAAVKASMVAPDLLPAISFPASDPEAVVWTLSPRFGFTYDLTGDGKTILRGNIARYGSQIGLWTSNVVSPSSDAGAGYFWNDLDGNDLVSVDELVGYPYDRILWFWGFDPSNPTNFEVLDAIGSNFKNELTDELLLGAEREIFTDFSLSATFTIRRNHQIIWGAPYDKESGRVISNDDFVGPITGSLTYEGTTYDYEYWTLSERRPAGTLYYNYPDYHFNYTGFEIAAVKRLSHKWMMNASFTYQIFTENYGENGYVDPTNISTLDGGRAGGVDWMAKLSFLYQLPWGFNFSGFANIRQGYMATNWIRIPTPLRAAVGMGAYMSYYLEKPGESRLPTFTNVDLSLTKDIRLKNAGMLTLCVDAFNVFNLSHTLGRVTMVNNPQYRTTTSILNPRVIRFGVRYQF